MDTMVGRIVRAWGRILAGGTPALSVELTRECPLRCPGCYAYGEDHLGGGVTLRQLHDLRDQALIDGFFDLVRIHRPLHVSIVGGEPLVRYRELNVILPRLADEGIPTQLVTSAVRPIPREWAALRRLQVSVSVDGLQPEHDVRRAPATYERILRHIEGHRVTIHCTITGQQARREGYLEEFVRFWSALDTVRAIWISLYTPQVGEISPERLSAGERARVIADLHRLRLGYPKLAIRKGAIEAFSAPPHSPDECIFAKTTTCVSADFSTRITPCQFGGRPDCADCGCLASMGLAAIGRHRLPGGLPVGRIFEASFAVGRRFRAFRDRVRASARPRPAPSPR